MFFSDVERCFVLDIEDFLLHRKDLTEQLLQLKETKQIIQKQQNFAAFFIEAYLDKKLGETFQWKIQKNRQNLSIQINRINTRNQDFSFEVDLEKDIKNQIDLQIQKI